MATIKELSTGRMFRFVPKLQYAEVVRLVSFSAFSGLCIVERESGDKVEADGNHLEAAPDDAAERAAEVVDLTPELPTWDVVFNPRGILDRDNASTLAELNGYPFYRHGCGVFKTGTRFGAVAQVDGEPHRTPRITALLSKW